jgi:hypothetical protein
MVQQPRMVKVKLSLELVMMLKGENSADIVMSVKERVSTNSKNIAGRSSD